MSDSNFHNNIKSNDINCVLSLHQIPNIHKLSIYEENEGFVSLKKAFKLESRKGIDLVKKSGLKERGKNSLIDVGKNWEVIFNLKKTEKKYLICNAHEVFPGSFKDKYIYETNPHLLLEGIIITSYFLGIEKCYISVNGEFYHQANILKVAIKECYAQNYLGKNILGTGFNLDIHVHRGGGGYLNSDDSGLIACLEGKKSIPSFNVNNNYYNFEYLGKKTLISNVETLSTIPWIIKNGYEKFLNIGLANHTGTKLLSVSGDVNKPGVVEVPIGTPLRDVIYEYCDGMKNDIKLKAILLNSIFGPVLNLEESLEVTLDNESLSKFNTTLGAGSIIVLNEKRSVGEVLKWSVEFFHNESCGFCGPCREGTGWIEKILQRSFHGKGRIQDIDLLSNISKNLLSVNVCSLPDDAFIFIDSIIRKFRKELEQYILEN